MNWQPPDPADVWKAIDAYLALAYPAGAPPASVRARLDALRAAAHEAFYVSAVFERAPSGAGEAAAKFSLRLGNRFYPHMKLVIERAPDGVQTFLRADTHDRHVQLPADSPEAAAFAELARKNQVLAQVIEKAWDERGLPTFKRFLRDDLERRRAERKED